MKFRNTRVTTRSNEVILDSDSCIQPKCRKTRQHFPAELSSLHRSEMGSPPPALHDGEPLEVGFGGERILSQLQRDFKLTSTYQRLNDNTHCGWT